MESQYSNNWISRIKRNPKTLRVMMVILMYLQVHYVSFAQIGQDKPLPYYRLGSSSISAYSSVKNSSALDKKAVTTARDLSRAKAGDITTITKKIVITDKDDTPPKVTIIYPADLKYGSIGAEDGSDEIYDNLFKVTIQELNKDLQYYLVYELQGQSSGINIPKSINDRPSEGGYMLSPSKAWSIQDEPLDIKNLQQGVNTIKFGALDDKTYQVRNLKIVTRPQSKEKGFRLLQPTVYRQGKTIYIKGYSPKEATVILLDKSYSVNGNIEIMDSIDSQEKSLTATIQYADGKQETKTFTIQDLAPENLVQPGLSQLPWAEKTFIPTQRDSITLGSTRLVVDTASIKQPQWVSVQALDNRSMMPIPPDMVNVTADYAGYRYLPHGEHFSPPATIAIGYDIKKIPSGYSPADIQTFYFDEIQKQWIALKRDTIDGKHNRIISQTTHFTDYINGVIQAPESPETGNYTPTTLSDIKAADPVTGVVSIAPPSPNQMGTVNTSFPIKLPAGRGGMQPGLEVSYSSEGGNGWMGIGWNLGTPAITIDTRWGVPRYDAGKETELYTLGGEQLTFQVGSNYVLPNRSGGDGQTRVADRQFYPRIEGGYARIIRKGSSPKDYSWEVTGKDGTKNIYGGDPAGKTVLKDAAGNIGYWALWKTIDLNGNYVEYTYDNTIYTGSPGKDAREMYISKIEYTKHTTAPSKTYTVDFVRTPGRKDVQIDGRLGFLRITKDLLSEIKISTTAASSATNGTLIRSYKFGYKEGPFFKTLLTDISEYDEAGNLFYTNTMEYEDKVRPDKINYMPFGPRTPWNIADDNLETPFLGINNFWGKYTSFSGSKSSNTGFNFSVRIGLFSDIKDFRNKAIGADGGAGFGNSETMITMLDIDGDGLIDKVVKSGGSIKYRKNLSQGGANSFGSLQSIVGISELGKSKNNSWNVGVSGDYGLGSGITVGAGVNYSNTTSLSQSYFKDFNADGLVDFSKNGKVYFNYINNGTPTFNTDSGSTPSPIGASSCSSFVESSESIAENNKERQEMEKYNPLLDVVRSWEAPKAGNITVTHTFNLENVSCAPDDNCDYADGVKVYFQQGNNNNLWTVDIPKNDYAVKNRTDNLTVTKGQKLYFRISSKYDGKLDVVKWNPVIEYTSNTIPALDTDNQSLNKYDANADFVNSVTGGNYMSQDGSYTFNLSGTKPVLSDNVTLQVIKENTAGVQTILINNLYPSAQSSTININQTIPVQSNDKLYFKILTDSNVKWSDLQWTATGSLTPSTTGAEVQTLNPEIEFSMYNKIDGNAFTYNIPTTYIGNTMKLQSTLTGQAVYEGQSFTLTAKQNGILLAKSVYKIVNGIATLQSSVDLTIQNTHTTQPIYIEVSTPSTNANFINLLKTSSYNVVFPTPGGTSTITGSSTAVPVGTTYSGQIIITGGNAQVYLNVPTTGAGHMTITQGSTSIWNLYSTTGVGIYYSPILIPGTYNYSIVSLSGCCSYFYMVPVNSSITVSITPANTRSPITEPTYGLKYRNWGSFSVNGDLVRTTTGDKLDESQLQMSSAYNTSPGNNPSINVPPDSNDTMPPMDDYVGNNQYSSTNQYFMMMTPSYSKQKWLGMDPDNYISKTLMQVSRLGEDNIQQYFEGTTCGTASAGGLGSVIIKRKINSVSVKGSASIGNDISGNGGISKTVFVENRAITSMDDMNGDSFPDLLQKSTVQFTSPLGNRISQQTNYNIFSDIARSSGWGVSSGFKHGNAGSIAANVAKIKKDITNAVEARSKATTIQGKIDAFGDELKAAALLSEAADKNSYSVSISGNYDRDNDWTTQTYTDINGDGLPDFINKSGKVRLNTGYVEPAEEESWGFSNIAKGNSDAFGAGLGFSILSGSFSGGINYTRTEAEVEQQFVDINGDGLLDKMIYNNTSTTVQFNTGMGYNLPNTVFDNYTTANGHMMRTITVANGGNIGYTYPIPLPPVNLKLPISFGASAGKGSSRQETDFKDMNGDGFVDFVESTKDGELYVSLSTIANTNYLTKVTTPTGGTWEVTYKRVGNTYDMPSSKYVMDGLTVKDNYAPDDQFTPGTSKIAVEYGNGFYSRRERDFYGFDKVRVNQLDVTHSDDIYRYTVQNFNNKHYYTKGQLLNETLFDAGGQQWTRTETTYVNLLRGATNPADSIDLPEEKMLSNYTYFVTPVKTTKYFYEGETVEKSTFNEIQAFDIYGNVTQFFDKGDPALGDADKVTSNITYHDYPTPYIVGLPSKITVTGGGVSRKRETTINQTTGDITSISLWNGTTPGSFDPAQTQTYYLFYDYDNGTPAVTPAPINPLPTLPDNDGNFGNLVLSVKPANSAGQRMWHAYQYDTELHSFPIRVDDAFGYYSTQDQDQINYKYGVPLYTVDMNNQPMRTVLDTKGRPTVITGPNELFLEGSGEPGDPGEGKAWTIKFSYPQQFVPGTSTSPPLGAGGLNPDGSWFAITRHYDQQQQSDTHAFDLDGIVTITISDKLGKPIQVKKNSSLFTGEGANNKEVWTLPGKVYTDAFGRAIKSYYPTTENYVAPPAFTNPVSNTATLYNAGIDTVAPTIATYDVLDRPLTTQLPGEDLIATMEYGFGNDRLGRNMFRTTVADELDHKKESFTDIKGRTTSVKEYSTMGDIQTSFIYDAIGQLITVTDVAGNITQSTYDNLGRRIQLIHPDNGTTIFAYDTANNLISRQTANLASLPPSGGAGGGSFITYNYDFTRLKTIVYPANSDGSVNPNNVSYYYGAMEDASAMDDNSVGRLWYMTDASGTQKYKYGRLGELTMNRRSVAIPNATVLWFQTEWKYDSWNRVQEIKYPDTEIVKYQYNKGGSLQSMTATKATDTSEIITQLGYDKFEQRVFLKYGNGTKTTYQYETERRRLLKMNASTPFGGGGTFIKNTYQYDVMSNVTSITNTAAAPASGVIGGPSQHSFAYDDLYRLTAANGSWKGNNIVYDESGQQTANTPMRKRYTLSMSYDQQHNILSKQLKREQNISIDGAGDKWTEEPEYANQSYNLQYDYTEGANKEGTANEVGTGGKHALKKLIDQPLTPDCCGGNSTAIPDGQIVYKNVPPANRTSNGSSSNPIYAPANSTLNSATSWTADNSTATDRYLQLDLGSVQAIQGVVTKGSGDSNQWVTIYNLQYSTDGNTWTTYTSLLTGNTDKNTPSIQMLGNTPINARYFRIIPVGYSGQKSLRADLIAFTGDNQAIDINRKTKLYDYDKNGNITDIRQYICELTDSKGQSLQELIRVNVWDEENRLSAVDTSPSSTDDVHAIQINTFDAGGERIIKRNVVTKVVLQNGVTTATQQSEKLTVYPSGMVVAEPTYSTTNNNWTVKYTKHYFAGSQRVMTKIGTTKNAGSFICDWLIEEQANSLTAISQTMTTDQIYARGKLAIDQVYKNLKLTPPAPGGNYTPGSCSATYDVATAETLKFYYHPDHLGSTSYITDASGKVSQHEEYIPFGESLVSEHANNGYNAPWKYNGKELDAFTGLYYYGARFYDPRTSIWLSVDPYQYDGTYLSGNHNGGFTNNRNFASYGYCYQSPINLIDPNGKQTDSPLYVGVLAHAAFANYMSRISGNSNTWRPEYSFANLTDNNFRLRADLMYFGKNNYGSIWELKPVGVKWDFSRQEEARLQMSWYKVAANTEKTGGLTWDIGTKNGNPKPFEGNITLNYDGYQFKYFLDEDTTKGMIYYTSQKMTPESVPEPEPVPSPDMPPIVLPLTPAPKPVPEPIPIRIPIFLILPPLFEYMMPIEQRLQQTPSISS